MGDADLFDPVVGFGTAATLAGAPLNAIVDVASDSFEGDVITQSPSARVLASAAPAAAPGQAFVAQAIAYIVRQVQQIPPDGAVLRLVLART
jgi:hypothetical protein